MSFLAPTRDTVTTIGQHGERNFLHPADVRGTFTLARRLFAAFLIAVYILLPWIHINGHPAVFIDLAARRFHLFGLTFVSQDMWILFFLLTGTALTGFLITALFGRLWCGWACPHTVFLEHVFRRIERWIEGPSTAQRLLDEAPWTPDKVIKRGSKLLIFFFISVLIAHIFLAYFTSIPALWQMMLHSPLENWPSFLFVSAASTIIFFNFTWFREQLCLIICPYGRLQSALIDDHSLIIGYDSSRGEPRGKRTAQADSAPLGDCIDCYRCVQVCPTGIDIRQGLQMECVGCANCIDACNEIMAKINRPKGLIRYDSYRGLQGKKTKFLRPRIIIYLVLFTLGITGFALSAHRIKPAALSVVRMTGAPYYQDGTAIRNQFLVRIINKQNTAATFHIEITGHPHLTLLSPATVQVPALKEILHPVIISIDTARLTAAATPLVIHIQEKDHHFTLTFPVEFLSPDLTR
jgi:cytochrome c oxidase accessory protein FixG